MNRPWKAEQEKLDRELDELLAETRAVLPGVTVLFAFLLTFPLQPASSAGLQRVSQLAWAIE